MISLRTVCIVLMGWTALGWCGRTQAQTTPKRPAPSAGGQKSSGEKSSSRPPAKNGELRVQPVGGGDAAPRKSQRPDAPALRIEPLPKELEQLLKEWERESAKVEKLVGKHKRIVYNKVFEVEKIAEGQFYYEAPDKGRIDLLGIEPKKGEQSQRISETTGNTYRLEKEQQTKWICNGKEVLNINEEEKTVEAFPLPPEMQGKNIIHGPLPFLFGMKAEEAKRRFALSFVDQDDPKKNNENVVWLTAKPRQEMDRDNFQEAQIILDRKRFLPLAVKLVDPSGNQETVYTFSRKELHVNQREMIPPIFRDNPFQPKLKGYKLIQQDVASPEDQKPNARDSGNRPRQAVRQASNEADGAGVSRVRSAGTNGGGTTRPRK